jgi:cAMP phosphodiesterase
MNTVLLFSFLCTFRSSERGGVSELYRLQKLVSEQRLQRLTTCSLQAYSLAHDQKYGLQRTTQYFIVQDFLSVSYIALSSEGGCLSPGLQPSSDRQMA